MAMHHVRPKPRVADQLRHRLREKQKPLRVVVLVPVARLIQLRPIIKLVAAHEQHPHAVRLLQLQHLAGDHAFAQRNLQGHLWSGIPAVGRARPSSGGGRRRRRPSRGGAVGSANHHRTHGKTANNTSPHARADSALPATRPPRRPARPSWRTASSRWPQKESSYMERASRPRHINKPPSANTTATMEAGPQQNPAHWRASLFFVGAGPVAPPSRPPSFSPEGASERLRGLSSLTYAKIRRPTDRHLTLRWLLSARCLR